MGRTDGAGMVSRLVMAHSGELAGDELAAVRGLLGRAFPAAEGGFDDTDWDHALGGMHALVVDGDDVLAHGSLVLRRLLHGDRALRCGYVEAVAVHPEHRRRGHGSTVLTALEGLSSAYELLALGSSDAGLPLYAARGWLPWRGPTSVLTPDGIRPTPDDDGAVLVRPGTVPLDLDAPLTCDWRDGDPW
nr:GNAT family N-acetyltransferase [Nocardioides pantholopis]